MDVAFNVAPSRDVLFGPPAAVSKLSLATLQTAARWLIDVMNRRGRVQLTTDKVTAAKEGRLVGRYVGVSLIGFVTDASLLHVGVALGLEPAWARLISLFCAMQLTFVLNGLHVFRGLDRKRLPRQWLSYMVSNGFGNFCNYWIFVTMVSTHWPVVSNHLFALGVGSLTAWVINYSCTRFFVFRKAKAVIAGEPTGPTPN